MSPAEDDSQSLPALLRAAFPHATLSSGPPEEPFHLGEDLHEELEKLGYRLHLFTKACNTLYHLSLAGKQPSWIADYLDRGKSVEQIERSRRRELRNEIPRVFVPEVIVTGEGYAVTSIEYGPRLLPLAAKLNALYHQQARAVLGGAEALAGAPESPSKPFFAEKLWLALFWLHPLRAFWRQELSERHFLALQKVIPRTWLIDPSPLPRQAVIGGLGVPSWEEAANLPRAQRDYVLQPSAAGRRVFGAEVSDSEWRDAIRNAVQSFHQQPHILQQARRGAVHLHPIYFLLEEKSEFRTALAIVAQTSVVPAAF